MTTFILRVAIPDRPGALGAIASRIGAVRGDVVSVEIVERDAGRAVDEFVVELPDYDILPLLLSEIAEVDGAAVEEAHPITGSVRDRRLDAYDTAALIVGEQTPQGVIKALTTRARHELDASWAAVVDLESGTAIATDGLAPTAMWATGFVEGRRRGDPQPADEENDIEWVDLAASDLVLVVGRPGWQFGTRERDRLAALARLADVRWRDVSRSEDRVHPARVQRLRA